MINSSSLFVRQNEFSSLALAQTSGAAPVAATTPPSNPSATALYEATQQLWISMQILKNAIVADSKGGDSSEIAYTLFADAVCNWESAYQSFTGSGGEPDSVSETINNALNETLPDGQTIYQLSQTVSQDPADWQELQSGVSNNTLYSLFEDVNQWIDVDGEAGKATFTPVLSSTFSTLEGDIQQLGCDLNNYINSPNAADANQVFDDINVVCEALSSQSGPICNILSELLTTPFFIYDGNSYSLQDIAQGDIPSGVSLSTAEVDALNACLPILSEVVDIAYDYILMQLNS